jgi:hypothetical protein
LVKNLAIGALISPETDDAPLEKYMREFGVKEG